MSTIATTQPAWRSPALRRPWGIARTLAAAALLLAMLMGARALDHILQSPGEAIRSHLSAAAAEMASPAGPYPTDAALRSIRRHFRGEAVVLDATSWPLLSITLLHLDRATCLDARRAAGRIEGLVVVELERYRSPDDCGGDNAMTWRIFP